MKRTRVCLFLLVIFCFAFITARQSKTAVAPAIVETEPTLQISPTSLNFGIVPDGGRSAAKTLNLQELGTTTVLFGGITITGTQCWRLCSNSQLQSLRIRSREFRTWLVSDERGVIGVIDV